MPKISAIFVKHIQLFCRHLIFDQQQPRCRINHVTRLASDPSSPPCGQERRTFNPFARSPGKACGDNDFVDRDAGRCRVQSVRRVRRNDVRVPDFVGNVCGAVIGVWGSISYAITGSFSARIDKHAVPTGAVQRRQLCFDAGDDDIRLRPCPLELHRACQALCGDVRVLWRQRFQPCRRFANGIDTIGDGARYTR